MIKSILKEVIIILILCLAIIGVLSILFYDYNPISKVVPNKVKYTTPENISAELEEQSIQNLVDTESRVYTIEGSDLNLYKKSKTYDPSKENPFLSAPVSEDTTGTSETVKTNDNGSGTTTSSSTSSSGTKTSDVAPTTKAKGSK